MQNLAILLAAIAAIASLASLVCLVLILIKGRSQDSAIKTKEELQAIEARIKTSINEFELRNTAAQDQAGHTLRTEVQNTLSTLGITMENRLVNLTKTNEDSANTLRRTLADNIEIIRKSVDEKLGATIEQRLGASFKHVGESLESVQRGLGEMRSLANGIGDLKNLLTNVKSRGTWGEVQLGALLEEVLTAGQFERNVHPVPRSNAVVEFAIKLPGQGDDESSPLWLPIDSKFPKENYERLIESTHNGSDASTVEAISKAVEDDLLKCARDIAEKYVKPPYTTDFAIMFLPSEGLYAEALRRPGFTDKLQSKYRIVVAGPTTLLALLNSLQMGFRTLAIQKRGSEVWKVLGTVKTEFQTFGGILERLSKNLSDAQSSVSKVQERSELMQKKLRDVEEVPGVDSTTPLAELPTPE